MGFLFSVGWMRDGLRGLGFLFGSAEGRVTTYYVLLLVVSGTEKRVYFD